MTSPSIWTSPSLNRPAGRQIATSWTKLADRFAKARPAPNKEGLWRWAPVTFRDGYRCRANVVRCHAVVIDLDDGSPFDLLARAFDGLLVIAHSTFSSTPEHPRWRAVVPLDQDVTADAYERVARWLLAAVEDEGGKPDHASQDSAHAWAVPARPPSGHYVTHVMRGSFACVADALVAIPAPEPIAMRPRPEANISYDHRVKRATAYLARVPPAIQGSRGSDATIWAANVLVRGFALDPDDALAILVQEYNPRCRPPWSERELRHKVRQALKRSSMPFGALAEKRRA